jgi:hypothetical protein
VKVAKDLRLPQFTLEMVSAKRCADKIHMGKHHKLINYTDTKAFVCLKVHKNENFFGFDFEFCTISLLVMHK